MYIYIFKCINLAFTISKNESFPYFHQKFLKLCCQKGSTKWDVVTLCWGDGYQALTWVCSSGNKKWRKMIQDTSSYWKWLTIWSFVFVILVCTPKATWTFAWQFNGSFSRKWWLERKCGRLGGCFLANFENWDGFFKCSEVFLAILCYLACVFVSFLVLYYWKTTITFHAGRWNVFGA